jgi:hypothetical protein
MHWATSTAESCFNLGSSCRSFRRLPADKHDRNAKPGPSDRAGSQESFECWHAHGRARQDPKLLRRQPRMVISSFQTPRSGEMSDFSDSAGPLYKMTPGDLTAPRSSAANLNVQACPRRRAPISTRAHGPGRRDSASPGSCCASRGPENHPDAGRGRPDGGDRQPIGLHAAVHARPVRTHELAQSNDGQSSTGGHGGILGRPCPGRDVGAWGVLFMGRFSRQPEKTDGLMGPR